MVRSTVVTAIAGTVMLASAAVASPVFVGSISFADSYGSTNGGEFRAIGGAGWAINAKSTGTAFQGGIAPEAGMFETFCMERFEGLEFGSTYKADLNTETVAQDSNYAGGNHGGFNDALDPRTAYLYHHFLARTLTTPYDYVNEANRIEDANALQAAIWYIEQEYDPAATLGAGKGLDLFNEADAAVTSGAWVGIGNVRVLNIYTNTARGDWQDVLVELVAIPLPGTSMMAGAGLLGLATIRRRK